MNHKIVSRIFVTIIIIAGMLLAFVPSTGILAADEPPIPPLTWNINIEPPPSPEGGLYADLPKNTSGQGDLDTLRQALFADTNQAYYLLAGPAQLMLTGQVTAGDALPLTLETNLSTGYNWQFSEYDQNLLSLEDTSYSRPTAPGSPQKVTFQLKALISGSTQITLSYRRPFEPEAPFTRKVDIQSPSLSSGLDISDPNPPALSAEDVPLDVSSAPAISTLPAPGLPTTFDWRSSGKVTPVKNQNPCGTCWAFSSIGAMESALLRFSRGSKDLSEQYLFDCDNEGYTCSSGGWPEIAADYLKVGGKYKAPQTTSGAVMESAKPYLGANGTCPSAYSHPYKITGWGYVTGARYGDPTADQIKNAIYTKGPIAVEVCAGPVFQGYSGGIYATNEISTCSGWINHSVLLTGWNDTENTWIMKNSWGTGWGESGYMRIRRGMSRIGFDAVYHINVTGEYPGFNSQFNGNSSGWGTIYGTWGINSYYYATGSPINHWSSARYGVPYTNFDYQARMYRPGTTNNYSNTLIVRGTPTPFQTSYHRWNKAYFFNYTNTGYYSIWRWMSNGETALKGWTTSPYIVKGGWNTLRVRALGSNLQYYINGHLVWNGTNTSISSGYVGLAKFNNPSTSYIYFDWATLTNLSAAGASPLLTLEQISPEQMRYNNAATSNPSGTDSTRGPAR